uniref:Uncharacterized protein n=1 Tax=Mimiviridae sp. ChoanoV1 TaxID=2596887 RepID=A0A5B8HV06_9VIRU|nr:hypothetical protein 1_184 [Mimiviridae sp. ChoanoV1]
MNLISSLLETEPERFIKLITTAKKNLVQDAIDHCITYRNYFSPILIQLLLLVGDKNDYWKGKKSYFGDNIDISNEKGIEIFDLLMNFNHDFEYKDYYGDTFKDKIYLYEKGEHIRKNNLEFINHVKRELGY